MSPLNTSWRGAAYALFAGLLWSFIGLVVRQVESADTWQILLYRSLAALPVVAGLIAVKKQSQTLNFQDDAWPTIIAALCAATATISMMIALHHTTVANTLLLISTAPLWSSAIARITLKERISARTLLCIPLALGGVMIMIEGQIVRGVAYGELAALISAASFAIFTVLLRYGSHRNMLPALCLGDAITGLVAFGVIVGTGSAVMIPAQDILLCVFLGSFFYGVGWVAYVYASKWLASAKMTMFALTEVALGPIWVWIFIDEVPQRSTLIGGVVIIVAIILQSLPEQRSKRLSMSAPPQ